MPKPGIAIPPGSAWGMSETAQAASCMEAREAQSALVRKRRMAGDAKEKRKRSNREAEVRCAGRRTACSRTNAVYARGAKGHHRRWERANRQQEESQFSTEGGSFVRVARARMTRECQVRIW